MAKRIKIGEFKISEKDLVARIINKIPKNTFNRIIKEIEKDLKAEST